MFCPKCGLEVKHGGGFCGKCGSAVSLNVSLSGLEPVMQKPQKISRWKKCAYIYGIVALIVFALKLFGIFPQFYKKGDRWTVKYRGLTDKRETEEIIPTQPMNQISSAATLAEPTDVTTFIKQQEALWQTSEYPDARKILMGDVGNDGVQDIVILYTLEGGNRIGLNNYSQFLAVISADGKRRIAVGPEIVGGKGLRSVELDSIEGGSIKLKTLNYAESDPACCPSVEGITHYSVAGGALIER